jgi:hypothetical protein
MKASKLEFLGNKQQKINKLIEPKTPRINITPTLL